MISCRTTLNLVLLAMLAVLAESSWPWSTDDRYPHDVEEMSDLTKLYNSRVVTAERVTRPLWYFFTHSGVRVTLEDDTTWLIHKGSGYGDSSQTVIVDDSHRSNKWTTVETKKVDGRETVSDFVKAGGTNYNLFGDNCNHACRRMMEG